MVSTTFVLGPLALIGVIFTVGLFMAVFFGRRRPCADRSQSPEPPSSGIRALITALTVVGGLVFSGLLVMAIVALIWLARGGSTRHFLARGPVYTSVEERWSPPVPPMPPSPQIKMELIENAQSLLDRVSPGDTKPPIAEADDLASGTTTALTQSAEAPLGSNETKAHNGLPEWATSGERRVDGVYRMPIAIGPFPVREDCGLEKPKAFAEAVKRFANEYLEEGAGEYVNLPMSYINQNIYRTEAEEHRETSLGPMVVVHYLLEFNDDVRQHIQNVYHQAQLGERLKYAGVGGAGVFGLLATLFGYLKLDTLSRGYYTGRLRAAAAVAILGLVAALLFVA